jgi:hypothetical protein
LPRTIPYGSTRRLASALLAQKLKVAATLGDLVRTC